MSYRETNSVPAHILVKLSKFIEFHFSLDQLIMVEFFELQEKRYIDLYVLIYYPIEGEFSFDTEEVNAVLAYYDDGDFKKTSDVEKEAFEKEHGFYKFNWFFPD